MSDIIKPGAGVLYMKVGTHAQEPLEQIITRKTKEIEEAGFAFWGYGGNTCHPESMVQPFAKSYHVRGQTVYLIMEQMDSKHFADQVRAEQFSLDGIKWHDIPSAINVLGSRYALVINNLRQEEFNLPLGMATVALGRSTGAKGYKYISGRVDKACFEISGESPEMAQNERSVQIGLVAELVDPFAVYVRNKTK